MLRKNRGLPKHFIRHCNPPHLALFPREAGFEAVARQPACLARSGLRQRIEDVYGRSRGESFASAPTYDACSLTARLERFLTAMLSISTPIEKAIAK